MYKKWLQHITILIIVYLITINHSESRTIPSNNQSKELTPSLYNASDNVVKLNATNFKSAIGDSKTAWFVEFYVHWCGYCQRFAPKWKALAKSVVGWRDIVTVAAINCADDSNILICRDHEIKIYPTIKFFSVSDMGIGVNLNWSSTEENMRQKMIIILQKDHDNGKGWNLPKIAAYRGNNSKKCNSTLIPSIEYHFLLFEENDSSIGSEVILDLHTLKNIEISRVTEDNEGLSKMYNVTSFPSLIALDRNCNQIQLSLPDPTSEGITQIIKNFIKSKGLITGSDEPIRAEIIVLTDANKTQPEIEHSKSKQPVQDILYQADLENALRYSLDQEIPLSNNIEGEQLQALRDYLKVISKYFPLKRGNSEFLSKLYNIVSERTNITGENFKELVQEMTLVFTENQKWIGCRGSSSRFRGYPCGLWTLFHTLTVKHAESFQNEEIDNRSVGMVLKAIYGYIKNFFGCADCRDHFMKMAKEKGLFNVDNVDNAILWLWRAHNEVNKRLSGDVSEDPEAPKIQYPSAEHCGDCRHSNGSWNDREVINYLKRKYGSSGIHYGAREGDIVRNLL